MLPSKQLNIGADKTDNSTRRHKKSPSGGTPLEEKLGGVGRPDHTTSSPATTGAGGDRPSSLPRFITAPAPSALWQHQHHHQQQQPQVHHYQHHDHHSHHSHHQSHYKQQQHHPHQQRHEHHHQQQPENTTTPNGRADPLAPPHRMEAEESNGACAPPGVDNAADSSAAKRAKMEAADSERLLNFATAADEYELSLKRQKMPRDPLSHRIIEKRRRDRMNNCLADLSRLIPSSYHKQGQGRIEKTEIIEMATRHIRMLQQKLDDAEKKVPKDEKPALPPPPAIEEPHCCATKFYMGFKEAQDEVMRFLVEVETISAMDPFCKKIMNHLDSANKKFRTKCLPPSIFIPSVMSGGDPTQQLTPHPEMLSSVSPREVKVGLNGSRHPLHGMYPHHHPGPPPSHPTQLHQSDSSGVETDNSALSNGSGNSVEGGAYSQLSQHAPHHQYHHPQQQQTPQGPPLLGHQPYFPPHGAQGAGFVPSMGSQEESSIEAQQRDQRLRSLLADQQQQQQHMKPSSCYSNSGVCSVTNTIRSGSMSETSSRSGMVPMFSYSNHLTGLTTLTQELNSGPGSSGYVSDLSNLEKNSPNGSSSSRENVYKFKHNITKRFCQEGHTHTHRHHHHQPSDSSSNDSGRDPECDFAKKDQVKWKSGKHKRGASGFCDDDLSEGNNSGSSSSGGGRNSGSSADISNTNSEEFNSVSCSEEQHNNTRPSSRRKSSSGKTSSGKNVCQSGGGQGMKIEDGNCSSSSSSSSSLQGTSSVALPGFILHPQGTHYMPISVHNANLSVLCENDHGPPVFHPISIPVHFRRPVISMPNVSICAHMQSPSGSSHRRERSAKE